VSKEFSGAAQFVKYFAPLMDALQPDKELILTTGSFTADLRVRDGVPQIELVDGEKLIGMLEKLELGLKP
jgi:hypothetical protein